ncbi:MAG: 30S ribosomal protein S12 methylthiotransferase RimO [Phycisphaerae bacterium]
MKKNNISYESPVLVGMISLGCPKNLVESETLLAQLAQAGFVVTGDYPQADVLIVNTCGFLRSAQVESAEVIDELAEYKFPRGRCRCLVVMGCWPQIAGKEILGRWKTVDAVVGVNDRGRIGQIIMEKMAGEKKRITLVDSKCLPLAGEGERLRLTPRHWCYLRISEGCSQRCSFCSIPSIRGTYRSKPVSAIVDEAKIMIADGVKEIILIGQETTNYGNDLGEKNGLSKLLARLNKLSGIDWIRLMYTYPANFTDATIRAIADLEHVVKYVDIPLQHINDRILKRMGRRIDRATTEKLLEKLLRQIPDLAIRTTLIVGFPGETDKEFQELFDFVRDFEFDALGAFAYSPEPGTRAAYLSGQVPEQIRLQRLDRLMKLQRRIAYAKARQFIGRKFDVYIEPTPPAKKMLAARGSRQAPQVDPVTLIRRQGLLAKYATPGMKLTVQCTASRGYDLIARLDKPAVAH